MRGKRRHEEEAEDVAERVRRQKLKRALIEYAESVTRSISQDDCNRLLDAKLKRLGVEVR